MPEKNNKESIHSKETIQNEPPQKGEPTKNNMYIIYLFLHFSLSLYYFLLSVYDFLKKIQYFFIYLLSFLIWPTLSQQTPLDQQTSLPSPVPFLKPKSQAKIKTEKSSSPSQDPTTLFSSPLEFTNEKLTAQLIEQYITSLNKLPKHVGFFIDEKEWNKKTKMMTKLAEIVCWCSAANIPYLTFYEMSGKLKDEVNSLAKYIKKQKEEFFSECFQSSENHSFTQSFRVISIHKGFALPPEHISPRNEVHQETQKLPQNLTEPPIRFRHRFISEGSHQQEENEITKKGSILHSGQDSSVLESTNNMENQDFDQHNSSNYYSYYHRYHDNTNLTLQVDEEENSRSRSKNKIISNDGNHSPESISPTKINISTSSHPNITAQQPLNSHTHRLGSDRLLKRSKSENGEIFSKRSIIKIKTRPSSPSSRNLTVQHFLSPPSLSRHHPFSLSNSLSSKIFTNPQSKSAESFSNHKKNNLFLDDEREGGEGGTEGVEGEDLEDTSSDEDDGTIKEMKKITTVVNVLGYCENRGAIIETIKIILKQIQEQKINCSQLNESLFQYYLGLTMSSTSIEDYLPNTFSSESNENQYYLQPDPDVLLICDNSEVLTGFLPWNTRLTHFFHIGALNTVTFKKFFSVLVSFSKTTQRFGR